MDKQAEQRLFADIDEIKKSIANINAHGCAKSPEHAELFRRVNAIELAQAEAKGKVAIVMIAVGVVLSVIHGCISKVWADKGADVCGDGVVDRSAGGGGGNRDEGGAGGAGDG